MPAATHHAVPLSTRREAASVEAHVTDSGWMQSPAVAKRLGVQTDTLKKWRAQGKGPKGWKRVSRTVVMYPTANVLEFEKTWHGTEPVN